MTTLFRKLKNAASSWLLQRKFARWQASRKFWISE